MSAAQTLQFPENNTPNAQPIAPQAPTAVPVAQFAAPEQAAAPAPQDGRRGQRQPVVIQTGPYVPTPKTPKAPKVRQPRQPRGLDLSGLATLHAGAALYISGRKEGTVRASVKKYLKTNGHLLAFNPEIEVLADGRVVVGRPAPTEA